MKKQLTKLALTAAFGLALTLLACEDKEKKQTPAETPAAEPAAMETQQTSQEAAAEKTAQYKTVKIGTQVWMAENLNIETGYSVCYDDNPDNCKKYGRLYDWNTAKEACPKGWHLPSKEEWQTLLDFSSGDKTANEKFSALSGGYGYSGGDCEGECGGYHDVGEVGYWWSASEDEDWTAYFYDERNGVNNNIGDKGNLYSVRCIQN